MPGAARLSTVAGGRGAGASLPLEGRVDPRERIGVGSSANRATCLLRQKIYVEHGRGCPTRPIAYGDCPPSPRGGGTARTSAASSSGKSSGAERDPGSIRNVIELPRRQEGGALPPPPRAAEPFRHGSPALRLRCARLGRG